MKTEEFKKEYKEFEDIYKIIKEPEFSKQILIEDCYDDELETLYFFDRYLRYGGKVEELPQNIIDKVNRLKG